MEGNKRFSSSILRWYRYNKRDLPWRGTQDPYLIWLSEIILQQTRVDQGKAYYHLFSSKYPKVEDLAKATEESVLKDWEGLGYYSRARNLHASAMYVSTELKGVFPTSYKELIKLKGVGPYTAAAISSICANEPVAVVDGNVYRVLARVFGIHTPMDSSAGKKEFQQLADELLEPSSAGDFNQALMEFGATHCKPNAPDCTSCIFEDQCLARERDIVGSLPFKQGKTKVRDRYFEFFVLGESDSLFIERRSAKDIWSGLFQFPLIETADKSSESKLVAEVHRSFGINAELELLEDSTKHLLSHQRIHARLWRARTNKNTYPTPDSWISIASESLGNYALPRLLTRWLETRDSLADQE